MNWAKKLFLQHQLGNYFKFVKEEAFSIKTRPNEIITKHNKLIDGSLKLYTAKTKKVLSTEKMHNPELNETEIWKKNNTNKNVYLTFPMPLPNCFKKIQNKQVILKNGSVSKAVKDKNEIFTLTNTCAFDSIVHLIAFPAKVNKELKLVPLRNYAV